MTTPEELICKHWIRDQTSVELHTYRKAKASYANTFKKKSCVASMLEEKRLETLLARMNKDPDYRTNKNKCATLNVRLKELVVLKRQVSLDIRNLKAARKFPEAKELTASKAADLNNEDRELKASKEDLMHYIRIVQGSRKTLKLRIEKNQAERDAELTSLNQAVVAAYSSITDKAKELCIENGCECFDLLDFDDKCVQGYHTYEKPAITNVVE